MPKNDPLSTEQRLQVNKRLTLNLFIQGAASHAFLGAHHVASDEFRELSPAFLQLYDRMMVGLNLTYWIGALPMIAGDPVDYFRNLDRDGNPFQFHPFMLKHGNGIAEEARAFIFQKADEHGLAKIGFENERAAMEMLLEALELEFEHKQKLEGLGRRICSEIYGIDPNRLDAELTTSPKFGEVRTPESDSGKLIEKSMIGWSAVQRREGQLHVVAKAWVWPLLIHERGCQHCCWISLSTR